MLSWAKQNKHHFLTQSWNDEQRWRKQEIHTGRELKSEEKETRKKLPLGIKLLIAPVSSCTFSELCAALLNLVSFSCEICLNATVHRNLCGKRPFGWKGYVCCSNSADNHLCRASLWLPTACSAAPSDALPLFPSQEVIHSVRKQKKVVRESNMMT